MSWALLCLVAGTSLTLPASAFGPLQSVLLSNSAEGRSRPKVVLDHIEFPAMLGGNRYKKHLVKALRKEAHRVDWGAGADSTIQYRFSVKELAVQRKGDAIVVKCEAVGRLPRGRSANSKLNFGGDPRHRSKLVEKVLEIVARGVISRLAEMERVRRGALKDARIIAPKTD